ncbi:MAG: methyltransferase type 11 [Desulfobacca sp.]|nr:methyltransferase type 11 [Desulfobacca sp.]
MKQNDYIMEDLEEAFRLDQKTDPKVVERQARWAGLQPGMRVADLGCGSGKTTSVLYDMVKPAGEAIGMDFAPSRWEFANTHYGPLGARFICRDVRDPLEDLGSFDFLWVRFLLEYYLSGSFEIVKHLSTILKPGGILCLIDLDHNCLNHYGITEKLEKTLLELSALAQTKGNFDPWAGRKLYSFLYDLGFEELSVDVSAHHLIFGPPNETDAFNWLKKVEVAPKKMQYDFKEYNGSYKDFLEDFSTYFRNPRRFIYTPVIACRGIKPAS